MCRPSCHRRQTQQKPCDPQGRPEVTGTVTPNREPVLPAELLRDLSSLLARLQAAAGASAVPLTRWSAEVVAQYTSSPVSTRCRMRQAVREICALAGPGATTAALTSELVHRYATLHPSRRSATTNGLLRALRTACHWALERGYLALSPFATRAGRDRTGLWRPKQASRVRIHSRDEVARVLGYLRERAGRSWRDHRLCALAHCYAHTGLRLREALRLAWSDVDFDRGLIVVQSEGAVRLKVESAAAAVPLAPVLAEHLRAWQAVAGADWVFPGERRDGPWLNAKHSARATTHLKRAGLAVGVPGFTPQSLRHTLATHLVHHWGWSERQVQVLLRHTTPLTQRWYVHDDAAELAERAAAIRFD